MEKLDYPWHIYLGDDMWIWHRYPSWSSVHCSSGMSVAAKHHVPSYVCVQCLVRQRWYARMAVRLYLVPKGVVLKNFNFWFCSWYEVNFGLYLQNRWTDLCCQKFLSLCIFMFCFRTLKLNKTYVRCLCSFEAVACRDVCMLLTYCCLVIYKVF